ncbi:predicted protein [Streptomyces sp. SPB78]|nr:predicted protein [Streptomyces sp. SPB78]
MAARGHVRGAGAGVRRAGGWLPRLSRGARAAARGLPRCRGS